MTILIRRSTSRLDSKRPAARAGSGVRAILGSLAGLSFFFLVGAAQAELSGPEILSRYDKATNAFSDGTFESKLLIKEPGGRVREYGFTTYQKVPEKRLVRFTAPGDVKGMGVLVQDKSTMYVFLPGFQRVRRVGSHVKNQTFMGSDFTYEDMSQLTLSSTFDANLVGSEGNQYVLELTLKPKAEGEFPRIKLWVDKTLFVSTRAEYYDAQGRKLKTQLRSDYKKFSADYWGPGKVVVTDHRRNDHTSEIQFLSTKINTGLGDDLFSVRSLTRGQ